MGEGNVHMINPNNYLDWYDLFVNQVFGNPTLFLFGTFAVIAFVCLMFKFKNIVAYTFFGLWALVMSAFFPVLLPITVFIIGSFFYWGLSKIIKD